MTITNKDSILRSNRLKRKAFIDCIMLMDTHDVFETMNRILMSAYSEEAVYAYDACFVEMCYRAKPRAYKDTREAMFVCINTLES